MTQLLGRIVTPNVATAPSSPSRGELWYDTAADALKYWNGTAWVSSAGGGSAEVNVSTAGPSPRVGELLWVDTDALDPPVALQRVSVLPGAPYDGQEINYVADNANGVVWRLRFNQASASAYKWEFLGGGVMRADVATGEAGIAAAGWVDLATVGPQIPVPLAGDYFVEAGATGSWGTSLNAYHVAGVARAATAPDTPWVVNYSEVSGAVFGGIQANSGSLKMLAVPAGTLLRLRYQNAGGTNSGTPTWGGRWLTVQPVRVG